MLVGKRVSILNWNTEILHILVLWQKVDHGDYSLDDSSKKYVFFDIEDNAISYQDLPEKPGCCRPTKTKCKNKKIDGEKVNECKTEKGKALCNKQITPTKITTCQQLKEFVKNKYMKQRNEIENSDSERVANEKDETDSDKSGELSRKETTVLINQLNKPQNTTVDDPKCPPL